MRRLHAPVAVLLATLLPAHVEGNRKDQAAARSRSALAQRAERAESEAEALRREMAKVKATAEKSNQKARKAIEMVIKETRAREQQAQKVWQELQEMKAAVFNSGSEEKVT